MRLSRASAMAVLVVAAFGCGARPPPPSAGPPPVALHLEPACDLAPSAGLEWIVEAKPRTVAEIPDLIPVIALVVPEARFAAFTASHGGVDVRQITDLCVARYRGSVLSIARTPIDPQRIERTFTDRVTHAGGRTVDLQSPPVVRAWGEVNGEAQQVVTFAREVVAHEQGKPGPIRAAEAFAQGKLRRASPALRGTLARAVELTGDAPVRAFAPGPFEGEMAQALGGLVRASTAVGISARFAGAPAKIALRVVLTGGWGKDAPAAADRLAAAVHVISESPFGRLLGLQNPIVPPRIRGTDDALVIEVTIDGLALARGVHDALDAEIGEIMAPR